MGCAGMEHAAYHSGTEYELGGTMNYHEASDPNQRKSMNGDSKERLELLLKVAIENLAERERLIEALCECILTLQRDTMN